MSRLGDNIRSARDPTVVLEAMVSELNTGRYGLADGYCELINQFSSYNEAKSQHLSGLSNGFVLRIPYAGTTVKFEMFFNLSDPYLTPDFVCLSDEDFYPDIAAEMPSLLSWMDDWQRMPVGQQISSVVNELMTAFRRYQHSKLRYVYPNLRRDCLGDVGDDIEVCLEELNDASNRPNWYLHALYKLPPLPEKTYQFVSNVQDAKGPIYLYWGIPLPPNVTSKPSNAVPEISLLRNEAISNFFDEFGFKRPATDVSEVFSTTVNRYVDAFNSFLTKTPQSLERRRAVIDCFSGHFQIVNVDLRRYSNATYLVEVGKNSTGLLKVTFNSLQSSSLPFVELISAYPLQRIPGASRKTFPIKLANIPNSLEQVKPAEFVEKLRTYLEHAAPQFLSDVSRV